MARRKKKRSGRKGFWKGIGNGISAIFHFTLKIIPLVVVLSLGMGLFIGVKNALYADSNLAIQNIVVEPPDSLSRSTLQDLETRYLGKNILTVDIERLSGQLEKDPRIKTAEVNRKFPVDLKIEIQERRPVAQIRFSSKGKYGLVSEDGVILDVLDVFNPGFVLIEAFHYDRSQPVTGFQIEQKSFLEAVRFLKAFWNHPLSSSESITQITIDRIGQVSMMLGKGPSIRLGRQAADRLSGVEKIMPLLRSDERNKIEYIDLQYENVIVKRK